MLKGADGDNLVLLNAANGVNDAIILQVTFLAISREVDVNQNILL